MLNDPYSVLGVSKGASPEDLRQAYRKLAKELHPDARPGDRESEERFKEVTAAFNFLSDPQRRRKFDRGEIDSDGREQRRARRRTERNGTGGGRESVFTGVFGEDGFGRFRAKGEDVRYRLELDFVEAANGGRKRVVMGDGKALDLVIPEGVRSGAVLRLRGQGRQTGRSSAAGDALVEIEVLEHPLFERRGDDVWLELPITLGEAIEGGKVRVPTLSGTVSLTVPKGSNSGQTLRMRGKGVRGDNGRGDQLVRLIVTLPDRPDAALQRFVSGWTPATDYQPRRKLDV